MSITTVTGLCGMSATELVDAIRSGQVSSQEVVEAHLRRIEEVNPAVNAVPLLRMGRKTRLRLTFATAGPGYQDRSVWLGPSGS